MFSPETVRPLQLIEHKRTNRDTTLALLLHTAGEGAETRSGEQARGGTDTHTRTRTRTRQPAGLARALKSQIPLGNRQRRWEKWKSAACRL